MKKKARALLIVDDSILLIRRTKGNEVYYVFPGGSVEDGETFEQACIRELQEELGVTVRVTRLVTELVNNDSLLHENFYEVEIVSGEIGTGLDPKFASSSNTTAYSLKKIPLLQIPYTRILPDEVKNKIIEEHSIRENFLMTLRDADVFKNYEQRTDSTWEDRHTAKIVLFNNDGDIALLGNKVNDCFLLPGGGIEDFEDIEAGLLRECREETGCVANIISYIGTTQDYRDRDAKHCITHCYAGKVISQNKPSLTEDELRNGLYVRWCRPTEALTILSAQEQRVRAGAIPFYNTCFNTIRDALFIKIALQ